MKLIVGAYYQALSLIHTCADSAVEGCVPQWKNRKFPISALTHVFSLFQHSPHLSPYFSIFTRHFSPIASLTSISFCSLLRVCSLSQHNMSHESPYFQHYHVCCFFSNAHTNITDHILQISMCLEALGTVWKDNHCLLQQTTHAI